MNDQHSFFLVIEGLDGSGKSEISRRLAELMRTTLDDRVMLTFEPHDPSAAGLYIRRVLRKKIVVSSHTLALAFALNRADHNERVIEPFLNRNTGHRVVLCDRYVLSSLVYNTSHDLPMRAVWDLNSGARRPDLTLFLDASAEICYARMGSRGGNRELFETNLADSRAHYFEAIEFLRQQGEQVLVIDANPDLLVVINSIIDALKVHGPRWLTLQKLMFLEATAPAMLTPPPLELDRWIRDFIDRYTPAALADAVYDDGIRKLVAAEVNNLPLDELAALMMNFLQTDRRYRFESAWPGQPIDYTVIRPSGESGGLVILQDERRWEGVMRALESEFIAPHYSIRRDAIQFVVALDPSHAGEEVAQFVPDTGSVPVEVYGRGTLIQYFTRYITRRVSAEHTPPPAGEPPQMVMPLPEDSRVDAEWSLAAALGVATPEEAALAEPDLLAEDAPDAGEYSAADEAFPPTDEVLYQEQAEAAPEATEAPLDAYYAGPADSGETPAEYAFAPLPEADESFAAYYAEPEANEPAGSAVEDYAFAPPPGVEADYSAYYAEPEDAPAAVGDAAVAEAEELTGREYEFPPAPEQGLSYAPYAAYTPEAESAPGEAEAAGEYEYPPAPEQGLNYAPYAESESGEAETPSEYAFPPAPEQGLTYAAYAPHAESESGEAEAAGEYEYPPAPKQGMTYAAYAPQAESESSEAETPSEYTFPPAPEQGLNYAAYAPQAESESSATEAAGEYEYPPASEQGLNYAAYAPQAESESSATEAAGEYEYPPAPEQGLSYAPYAAYTPEAESESSATEAAGEYEYPPAPEASTEGVVSSPEPEADLRPDPFADALPAPEPPAPAPPAPEDDEMPWHRRPRTGPLGRRDTGEFRPAAPMVSQPAAEPEPQEPPNPPPAPLGDLSYDPNAELPWRARHRTGPLGRRDGGEARHGGEPTPPAEPNFAFDPFPAPPVPTEPEPAGETEFSFELPEANPSFQAEAYAMPPITQEEMEAIAALYNGLDDALRARAGERAAPDEEPVEGEEERG